MRSQMKMPHASATVLGIGGGEQTVPRRCARDSSSGGNELRCLLVALTVLAEGAALLARSVALNSLPQRVDERFDRSHAVNEQLSCATVTNRLQVD